MRLIPSNLRDQVIAARLSDCPRILPTRHRATPADAGLGLSRYSSPTDAFQVLHVADSLATAFAEAVVRDRFEDKARRYLYRPYLEQACLTAISSSRDLTLLDLRGAAAYELITYEANYPAVSFPGAFRISAVRLIETPWTAGIRKPLP